MQRPDLRRLLAALAVSLCLLSAGDLRAEGAPASLLAAGDIAFCERGPARKVLDWFRGNSGDPGADRTATLLDGLPGPILALGDLAYWNGSAAEFSGCYDPAWGRHKDRTYPAPGNHEYRSSNAAPYFAYWGARAGNGDRGYYSFDLGAWHLIALNSNLTGEAMAAQETWLGRDLAESLAPCLLAYWHHPLFSSGKNGDQPQMLSIYRRLYQAGASLVLAGHDHNYERFAPLDPEGRPDPTGGIRSFVVGTGGGQLKPHRIQDPPRASSERVDGSAWGVLQLTLHSNRYDWRFVPVAGHNLQDSGSALCVERTANR